MTPAVGFSWARVLRGLLRPGAPPSGLPRTGLGLLAACLAAVAILVWLGHVAHGDPHHYFGERKAGTYLSFLNLLATAAVSASIGRWLGPAPFARFWWAAAIGFVWLGCDDLFTLHERIDRAIHALLGLNPDHPVTDHLDDLIVAAYGVAALGLAHRHRADLQSLPWMHRILGAAFLLFGAMVIADVLHWSKTVEDGLKLVAGTLILVGFLAARGELRRAAHRLPALEEHDDLRGADDRGRAARPAGLRGSRG